MLLAKNAQHWAACRTTKANFYGADKAFLVLIIRTIVRPANISSSLWRAPLRECMFVCERREQKQQQINVSDFSKTKMRSNDKNLFFFLSLHKVYTKRTSLIFLFLNQIKSSESNKTSDISVFFNLISGCGSCSVSDIVRYNVSKCLQHGNPFWKCQKWQPVVMNH